MAVFCTYNGTMVKKTNKNAKIWSKGNKCVCLLMQKLKFSFLALIEHIKFVDRREGEMGKVSVRRRGGRV